MSLRTPDSRAMRTRASLLLVLGIVMSLLSLIGLYVAFIHAPGHAVSTGFSLFVLMVGGGMIGEGWTKAREAATIEREGLLHRKRDEAVKKEVAELLRQGIPPEKEAAPPAAPRYRTAELPCQECGELTKATDAACPKCGKDLSLPSAGLEGAGPRRRRAYPARAMAVVVLCNSLLALLLLYWTALLVIEEQPIWIVLTGSLILLLEGLCVGLVRRRTWVWIPAFSLHTVGAFGFLLFGLGALAGGDPSGFPMQLGATALSATAWILLVAFRGRYLGAIADSAPSPLEGRNRRLIEQKLRDLKS